MIDIFKVLYRMRSLYWKILSITVFPALFGSFGGGSVLVRPLQIRGSRNIRIGKNVIINQYAWLFADDNSKEKKNLITIGDNVYIGHFAHIAAINCISIEENVLVADRVYITDHNHRHGRNIDVRFSDAVSKGPVRIGKGCWIGEGACILSGVEVGEGSVIGANAVVTNSIPSNCMAAGSPAKVIKLI